MTEVNYSRVEKILKSLLMPNEELISLYQSRKSKSVYACVLTDDIFYKVIRVGDHKAITPYFSQPTFDIFKSDLELKADIREFLYKNSGYKFDYKAYYVLKAIQESAKFHYRFFLADDYKTIHKQADFYLLKNKAAKVEAVKLSEQLNKVLRKLFSGGLVSIYREAEFDKSVYVSAFTLALLERVKPIYETQWQRDVKNINWYRFDLPQRYLPKTDKGGAIIEYVWVTYDLQNFQEKRYYRLYPSKKYYQNYISTKEKLSYRLRKLKRYLIYVIRKHTKRKKVEKIVEKTEKPETVSKISSSQQNTSQSKVKEKTPFEPKRHNVKMTGVVDDKSLAALMTLKDELSKK
ncbi:hypothetical protein CAC02_02285 [Streptococcus gallolyticus]|uniref:Uncharacterized protein n=1 Tax=Streptococcus gallolyticus TaxID=315405 RepID=A0A368UF64_9STRE|nr:hypothetical protein [Streptococcus gallolyticus]RCW17605.1 hypothetical protein CAC02_02285 [Streptococcus gallolyticus]